MQRFQKLSKKVADKFGQSKAAVVTLGTAIVATTSQAADLVAPTFNAGDAVTVGTAVLGGMALIWGIKKAIGMAR